MEPQEIRSQIREQYWTNPTSGVCDGFVQANLVILPSIWARSFLDYCRKNPQPLPLLGFGQAGNPYVSGLADGADIRSDVAQYCVYRHGKLEETVLDIGELWQDDWVWILLGCSFTAEQALKTAGVHLWHLDHGRTVPMYKTQRQTQPAGPWSGELVVSMRWVNTQEVALAQSVTSQFALAHGAPVDMAFPNSLGISDLSSPDWGEFHEPPADAVPLFWACGVTSQSAIMRSAPPIAITHAPGHMFITDWPVERIRNVAEIEC